MVSTITIKNLEKFKHYLMETQKVARPYGAELVHRGKANKVLTDHTNDHNMIVIVKFPNLDVISQWINSDDYKALIPLREEAADMKMVSYDVL